VTHLRACRRLAAFAAALLLALSLVGPALAQTRDDGEQPGPGLSAGQTFLIFVVVPLGISALVALLTFLPSIARGPRYRPGRSWNATPVWFGGPDNPDEALRRTTPDQAARTERGGTSAHW
jgi:hypothetical protein